MNEDDSIKTITMNMGELKPPMGSKINVVRMNQNTE